MKLNTWLFSFCLLLFLQTANSQTYNFRTYSEDQGLPNAYVYCITQSPEGLIYLSTGESFSTFNGYQFANVLTKDVTANFVSIHFTDFRNVVWLGHLQNGLSYIKNGLCNEVKLPELAKSRVTHFAEDKKKNMFVSTLGGGIFKTDTSFVFKALHNNELLNTHTFLIDKDGSFLVGTEKGLFLLREKTNTLLITKQISFFNNKCIKQLLPVSGTNDLFWVLTESEGIYGVRREGNSLTVFAHIFEELSDTESNIPCMYNDLAGNLWVSLFGSGLRKIVFIGSVQKANYTVYKINGSNGLRNLNIQSIFEDFEGNMWFGTFGGGLIEKPIEKFSFYGIKAGTKNINVGQVAIDADHNIWMSTSKGLGYFNPVVTSNQIYDKSNGFVNDQVNTLLLDSTGLLWIGTANNGIYTYHAKRKTFENFSTKNKLSSLTVNAILQNNQEMIIATDDGIIIYDLKTLKIQFYTTADGLLHNNLVSIFYDSRQRLWISSHGTPPYYIEKGKVKPLKKVEGLSSFNINAITEDKKGMIWIATDGDGVFSFDGHKTKNYKMKDGLASNYCKGIAIDKNNSVWITHLGGLSTKDTRHDKFHPYAATDGLLFTENNLNAIFEDANEDLWFGTTEGIIHYNASLEKVSNIQPKLSILKVRIDANTFKPNEVISAKYGFHNVKIQFLAIALSDPDKINYKYRLLDVDSTWSNSTRDQFVNYPKLSDGDYTFQVLACNGEGVCTSTPAEVKFNIQKPIWKKLWFYFFLLGLIILITYLIILWRTKSLRTSQLILQTKVKQKTFLLQREKEEVEKIKGELEVKNKDTTDSINYAKRIQDSLLPLDETMDDLFNKKHFIYYKPKDIVSGDFYWAARFETGGDKKRSISMVAVADCTGHGVPGAFLSIVASSFLKQSLSEKSVNTTGEVLDYLNKNITATLNPSLNLKNRISDGLDLAIVAIDYELSKLYYAGANNSIYIFRTSENETNLFVLKPTKQAIGSTSAVVVRYKSHTFDIQAGDTIYLFSDGYADQFGGEKDKKLNYKRFKDILRIASEIPLSMQRGFIDTSFENWRGSASQTDDICILGLKV